jgi:Zn-finger protein
MKTYTLKRNDLIAEVEGDITFNSDGSINYVWSCANCFIQHEDGRVFYNSMGNVSGARLKHLLKDFFKA